MKHNVVTPSVGESVTEVGILKWNKLNGQAVKIGDVLVEIESDKATVELVAESNGVLQIIKQAGERIPIGATIAQIDDATTATASASQPAAASPKASVPSSSSPTPTAGSTAQPGPAARKMLSEAGLESTQIPGSGKDGRVTKGDVIAQQAGSSASSPSPSAPATPASSRPSMPASSTYVDRPGDRRVPMSMLRQRIAERLVQAQHTAAILTTFNEADMSAVMKLRAEHKDAFKAKHGVSLGFMSFFSRACIEAFKTVPEVNAMIDGRDVIYHDYVDLGIAVGTERGLVVPVVRDAQKMGFVDIEKTVTDFGVRAKSGKLTLPELSGGTFTISNGGVYGSLLSTPILNMPQAGILGMHKIQERPIAVNGKVEIRPMMYLALSYDHRIIDGKGAVTFLVAVKDLLENPEKLGLTY